ncbi:MAG: FtsX-like permease family protein [Opitutaceae bacterium]|jgi:lipoprotein-releasing system permease protein|nr:FtsX-like permease family protein [Opitutaceae bacterium]
MPWYFYLALKQLFPTGRRWRVRVTFFTAVSLLGVAAGVWLLIAATGVMGGFGHKYGGIMRDTQGDIQVRGHELIRDIAATQALIDATPGVLASTPFAEGLVMVHYENRPAFPAIQGIDVNQVGRVIPLTQYLAAGSLDDLDDDTVILGAELARVLGVGVGGKLQVVTPLFLQKIGEDEILLPAELAVAGILEIGHQQLDKSIAIVTLRRMQDLYGLGPGAHGFSVKLAPGADLFQTTAAINDRLPPAARVRALTWMEANDGFLFSLRLEKMMIMLITSFIVLNAMFLVTALLLIAVVRKTREIGLLGALGAPPRQTAACFCIQGFLVGVLGTALGLALGFLTLGNIDGIFKFVGFITGQSGTLIEMYQFIQVPAHITPGEVAGISAYAIVMATLAGLIAAWRAARLDPVEAMRSE